MEAPNFDGITTDSHVMGWQAGELYHGLPRPSSKGSEQHDVKKFRLDQTDALEATGKSRPEVDIRYF